MFGIVMEFVAGQDLRNHLRGRGTLPPAEAAGLTRQILDGVATVHASGVIHRDIKPENLLLDTSGRDTVAKLTDFGVARLSSGTSLTKRTSLIGTPEYMAPELADHGTVRPAADLYSTGILLYEMLGGGRRSRAGTRWRYCAGTWTSPRRPSLASPADSGTISSACWPRTRDRVLG